VYRGFATALLGWASIPEIAGVLNSQSPWVIGALGVVKKSSGDGKQHTKRALSKAVLPRVLNIRIECRGPEFVPYIRAHVLVQKLSAAIKGPLYHFALGRRANLRRNFTHTIKRTRFVFEETNVVHIGALVDHRKYITVASKRDASDHTKVGMKVLPRQSTRVAV
jgi:hypothetical protein